MYKPKEKVDDKIREHFRQLGITSWEKRKRRILGLETKEVDKPLKKLSSNKNSGQTNEGEYNDNRG